MPGIRRKETGELFLLHGLWTHYTIIPPERFGFDVKRSNVD